ncbi:MAG TPA: DEAD/DEAH box helicase family protein, partial [Nodosilinea sp.]|nr:DEAD/DEAH box helicase family protein [Nodosilinea sp.]
MGRTPTLTYDRGTLILHPPPRGKCWVDFAHWDDRIEKFRIPAHQYRALAETLRAEQVPFDDQAHSFAPLALDPRLSLEPYPHQREALQAWVNQGWQGVVVLPTASGKTYLAQLAMQTTPRPTLITVPTLDLMHQWYAHLKAAFPDVEVGL